ncbi:epi-isozizaene 5-monooxygenase/(E)-beta-farnesene synthase [Abditibacteriota bacterium]|nr:epi-isozizaene 5-monooxygenase/(E)-beta-farnesene synthase [Abditibacteriota bacterium]
MPVTSAAPQPPSPPLDSVPPGPSRQWLADFARTPNSNPFEFLMTLTREFGDIVHYSTLYGPVYFFNHPEGVRQVLHNSNLVRAPLLTLTLGQGLLASDGDYWRKQRRLMQPNFHENCLIGFVPLIIEAIEQMVQGWNLAVGESLSLDIAHEMKILTFNIIARAMFSADLSAQAETICEAIGTMVEDLGSISCTLLNGSVTISPRRNAIFTEALATADRAVYELIEERRASQNWPRDLLSTLLQFRDAETGEPLTDRQLRDEIVTVLIAGHETTAISLSWAWHLLAKNTESTQRLQTEADEVLAGRLPGFEDLTRLTYAEMVFNEAMRLYPPVWVMVRRALEDDEIAGYPIPAGAFVLASAYTTQRHPEFWPDPERFDPERFAPNTGIKRPLYAHFPFAGGRHLCLGQRFAIIEAQLILASLAQRFHFRAASNAPILPLPVLTLRQQRGIPMVVERRQ